MGTKHGHQTYSIRNNHRTFLKLKCISFRQKLGDTQGSKNPWKLNENKIIFSFFHIFVFFFFAVIVLVGLGFELRASHLQSKHFTS
jgi:hypothetical protein